MTLADHSPPNVTDSRGGSEVRLRDLLNSVAGSETNPLRDRAVLLLRLSELLLGAERLVALQSDCQYSIHTPRYAGANADIPAF